VVHGGLKFKGHGCMHSSLEVSGRLTGESGDNVQRFEGVFGNIVEVKLREGFGNELPYGTCVG
jgi:hypothetical protein